MTTSTISRDASRQGKGAKLQRQRATLLILEALEQNSKGHVMCSVEFDGDVAVKSATPSGTNEYSEENKNYDPSTSFTFASREVLNTMVIFLDAWLKKMLSENCRFGFYATNNIGKELQTDRLTKLGVTLPKDPILQSLSKKDYSDAHLLPSVKTMALEEYASQYQGRSNAGYFSVLQGWGDKEWIHFLNKIDWQFGQPDEKHLQKELRDRIRKSRHFDQSMDGKEELIRAAIIECFDEVGESQDPTERFIHMAQVELIFVKAQTGVLKNTDPAWNSWDKVESPSDLRNIHEKLTDACPGIAKSAVDLLIRKAATGTAETTEFKDDKSIKALQFQIFDVCSEKLLTFHAQYENQKPSEAEIRACVDELVVAIKARMDGKQKDYTYSITNEDSFRNILLHLFDSCFLAFDRGRKS